MSGSTGNDLCEAHDCAILQNMQGSGECKSSHGPCSNLMLVDFVTPILSAGTAVAFMFSGQLRPDGADLDLRRARHLTELADRHGASPNDVEAWLRAVEALPPMPDSVIADRMRMLDGLADSISDLAGQRLRLERTLRDDLFCLVEVRGLFQELVRDIGPTDSLAAVLQPIAERLSVYSGSPPFRIWRNSEITPAEFSLCVPSHGHTPLLVLHGRDFDQNLPEKEGLIELAGADSSDLQSKIADTCEAGRPPDAIIRVHVADGEQYLLIPDVREAEIPKELYSDDYDTLFDLFARTLKREIELWRETIQAQKNLTLLGHQMWMPLKGMRWGMERARTHLSVDTAIAAEALDVTASNAEYLDNQVRTTIQVFAGRGSAAADQSLFKPVELLPILRQALKFCLLEATEKRVVLEEPRVKDGSRAKGAPVVLGHAFSLTTSFQNLLHNAVKYSYSTPAWIEEPQRSVTTRWWLGEHPELGRRGCFVAIQDYGVGMEIEEISEASLFEYYRRGLGSSDRSRQGSGLGLHQAFIDIVNRHNGDIAIESERKPGGAHLVTVTVFLPAPTRKG